MKQHKKKKEKKMLYSRYSICRNMFIKESNKKNDSYVAVEFQCLSFPSIYFRVNERKIKTYYSLHGVKFVIIRCTKG